jgi:hypothetical protein
LVGRFALGVRNFHGEDLPEAFVADGRDDESTPWPITRPSTLAFS